MWKDSHIQTNCFLKKSGHYTNVNTQTQYSALLMRKNCHIKRAEAKALPLSMCALFLSFSLCHTHTDTAYSLSLSRPVSHTITPVRRGDNPSQERGGGGVASWVMSVDTCQKYSLCPEKAVCGVTAVRLPLTSHLPPPPTTSRRQKSFLS